MLLLQISLVLSLISLIQGHFLSGAFNSVKRNTFCKYSECCENVYIKNRIPDFNQVFGQHLALQAVNRALSVFYQREDRNKPLVLSFHGTPGTGKNYVADHIVRARYAEGKDSKYVHFYSGRAAFPLDNQAQAYSGQLLETILSSVRDCPHQTFIFDEVDKIPPGVFEAFVGLMDHNTFIKDADFSKCLFIFISNLAGVEIGQKLSLVMRKEGLTREDTSLMLFERVIEESAYNGEGAFRRSRSIEKAVIDYYIPFLPLEQRHVVLCIQRLISRYSNKPMPKVLEKILKTVHFEEDTNMFAASGCKKLEARVDAELHTEL